VERSIARCFQAGWAGSSLEVATGESVHFLEK
jgi:hypothetical protein